MDPVRTNTVASTYWYLVQAIINQIIFSISLEIKFNTVYVNKKVTELYNRYSWQANWITIDKWRDEILLSYWQYAYNV